MTFELAPSILSCDPGKYRDAVAELIDAGADRIHFDVMDGRFVPPITFGAGLVKSLRDLGTVRFEAHLMTLHPETHLDAFIDAGCQTIVFHAEATQHAHRIAQSLRDSGVSAGIAINPGTPAEVVRPVLESVDLVLVMTVNPGWGGQSFLEAPLEKVRQIRQWSGGLDIEVDGGIDPRTLVLARGAGANVFVAGSFLAEQTALTKGLQELRAACG